MNNQEYTIIDFKPIPMERSFLGMRLLKRIDDYALYATNCYSFEIHLIRIQENVKNPFTHEHIKVMDKLAGSEDFGSNGWCFERLNTVFRYFGMFGPYVDEILDKLDEWGYAEVDNQNLEVLGYLF